MPSTWNIKKLTSQTLQLTLLPSGISLNLFPNEIDDFFSPRAQHVVIGGGQDARDVTTTAARDGKFDARFFHMLLEEEFGRVKGHFGPINTLAFHPDGKSYCSGEKYYACLWCWFIISFIQALKMVSFVHTNLIVITCHTRTNWRHKLWTDCGTLIG